MVASVGSVGTIRSVSNFDSSAVDSRVSAASRASVNRFCVLNARSFIPMQYGSSDHCAYETDLPIANFLSDPSVATQ
jgi:hypothetical protein